MCNNHVIHGRLEEDVINDLLSSFDLIFIHSRAHQNYLNKYLKKLRSKLFS